MTLLKTKEAAQQLVVSETTIRRWVSTFPASFRKDMFGHYIFDAPAMNKLRQVKGQLDAGTALYDIKLPTLAEEDALAALAAEVVGAGASVQAGADGAGGNGDGRASSTIDRAAALGRNANSSVLVVDRAGNVRNAGPGEVDLATAEITTGVQHAAAGAGGNNLITLAPHASDADQSHEASQVTVPSAPVRPSSHLFDEPDPMLERLNAIENALSQKADEVVTVQLLHHRKELEELRKSLTELAASIEAIRNPEQPSAAFEIAPSTEAEGKRKKRGFRSFFFF